MKKKMFIILLLIIGVVSITACNKKEIVLNDSKKFKEEYESFNGQKNDYFEYRNLFIDENNPFVYITAEDIVEKIENKETFIVYFGDPECPWCRSVIEQAIESANKNNIGKIYYVRIWDGFHNEILRDVYKLQNGKTSIKSKGTDAYYRLLEYFDDLLDDYILIDEKDKEVKVNEKRIFAPDFVFVKDGVAKKIVQGISSKQENFNSTLTEDVIKEEESIFDDFFTKTNTCYDNC